MDAAVTGAVAAELPSALTSVRPLSMPDDFSRELYCLLGTPVEATDMGAVLRRIDLAASARLPYLISTVNLNFLVKSQSDPEFRKSLILSDLCTADGMPIVWIAWLLGIQIKYRVAGSDILDALKTKHSAGRPLKIFLFGGLDGVAAKASELLNAQRSGLCCVGSLSPGFGSVEDMSGNNIIDLVNSSGADFLVASLGAQKGQSWLIRNHNRFSVPIRAHLGASLNFQAGTLRRAPLAMRDAGLEWLWRIKEEPHLWRRYWYDGRVLLRLLFTRIAPFIFWNWWLRLKNFHQRDEKLVVALSRNHDDLTIVLSGAATARNTDRIIPVLREAAEVKKKVIIDFAGVTAVDARFLGLLLMLTKKLDRIGAALICAGVPAELSKIFRFNGFDFDSSTPRKAQPAEL